MQDDQTIEGLESASCLDHQRREMRLERLGWLAMAMIVSAALLGLLGPGLLSWRQITTVDQSLALEYAAIVHHEAPGEFKFRIRPISGQRMLRLSVARSFCDHTTLEAIVPRPVEELARDDDVVYQFAVDASEEFVVMFRYSYDDFGMFDHRVAVEGRTPLEFRQYVLP